jgi:hypothetical protein
MVTTEDGMQMVKSKKQLAKTASSISRSLESPSNVTIAKCLHPQKHPEQRTSTDEGMQIVEINAKPTASAIGGLEKQCAPMTATPEGMQIVESDRQTPNASFPISTRLDPAPNVTIESRSH